MIIRNYCQFLSGFVVMGLSPSLLDIHHEMFTSEMMQYLGFVSK